MSTQRLASSLLRSTTRTARISPRPQMLSNSAPRYLGSTSALAGGADHADHGGHHEDHYDAPSGWLFGVKPGETKEKEGWETIWYWGFFGALGLGVVGYVFKPDSSIQTWALEEARRRLEKEGILEEPKSK